MQRACTFYPHSPGQLIFSVCAYERKKTESHFVGARISARAQAVPRFV